MAAAMAASALAQEPANQPQTPPPIPQDPPRVAQLKKDAVADVDAMKLFTQQMVDSVFSFGELGFQEFETNRYLIDILRKNGYAQIRRSPERILSRVRHALMLGNAQKRPVVA